MTSQSKSKLPSIDHIVCARGSTCHDGRVPPDESSYYGPDLALVHHRGFGSHAAACAPGILELLAPVRARGGLILELGCGSGLLTKELVAAGHRVLATDASPAMLELAHQLVGDRTEIRRLTLPDDPLPRADAIVAVGHPLNYLPDLGAFERAVDAIGRALRPGGVVAFDVCDLEWGRARQGAPPFARSEADWALITEFSIPSPDRFVRDITTFLKAGDGTWRRETERHENVLVDTARIPARLARHGIEATVRPSFGTETLLEGLVAVVGRRAA
jgi:SAM-dependent methyltransferase